MKITEEIKLAGVNDHLAARGYKNKTIGFTENGSWAPWQ